MLVRRDDGSGIDVDLVEEDGRVVWHIEVLAEDAKIEYPVDAESGEVTEEDRDD